MTDRTISPPAPNKKEAGTPAPRVSVLMSVYNDSEFLRLAIESILQQTYQNFEFLIIDDGSTDDSRGIIRSYQDSRIRLIVNDQNMGLTQSLNKGLNLSKGSLIARMDSDDIAYPQRFARQVAFLEAHPDVAVVGTQVRTIDENGRPIHSGGWKKSTSWGAIRWQLIFDNPLVHTTVMFRRSVIWNEFGGYAEEFPSSQDFELWSRVAGRHRLANLPDGLMDFRVHSGSVSWNYKKENEKKLVQVLQENVKPYWEDGPGVLKWVEFWVCINNARNFGVPLHPARLVEIMENIYRGYLARHPEDKGHPELLDHWASTLARIACIATGVSRWQALVLFAAACRTRFAGAGPLAMKFLQRWILGDPVVARSWVRAIKQALNRRKGVL